jgi:hypothetical protein
MPLVRRTIRAVQAMGLPVHSVEIDPVNIKVRIGTSPTLAEADPKTNPWDKKELKKDAKA